MACTSASAGAQETRALPPCRGQLNVIDQDALHLSVRVRANCPLGREQLAVTLADLKSNAFTQAGRPRELRIDLGRMADYPWLSTALARAALNSKEWDRIKGRPRQRPMNDYANALVRVSGALEGILPGWSLQSVSTEKVLVQPIANIPALTPARADKSFS